MEVRPRTPRAVTILVTSPAIDPKVITLFRESTAAMRDLQVNVQRGADVVNQFVEIAFKEELDQAAEAIEEYYKYKEVIDAITGGRGEQKDDPKYERGQPAQLDKWRQAHRIGGAHAIPAEVYERGHKLGLTGEEGENRIRVPDWTRTRGPRVDRPKAPKVKIAVDHIIELQVTPAWMRDAFDSVDNYELLTETANVASRNRIRANINAERAKQVACDPSKKDQILTFDQVELSGGQPAERWTSQEIRSGEQLDAYS
jgi:hypothetical protein